MPSKLRFGIIGCGTMGNRHAEILARHPRAALAGVCSRRVESARALAARFDAACVYPDADALLDSTGLDAVIIATHHDSHLDLALQTAGAGIPALIEKPLALTPADCERIAHAFDAADVPAGVVFNWRFSPLVQEARRRMPAPSVLTGCMMDDRWPDNHWAQQADTGGGNLLAQGCHMIDLLCNLAGARAVHIAAQTARATHLDAADPDQLVASIRFDNGAIASWTQGDAGCPQRGSKVQVNLFGAGQETIEIHDRCKAVVARVGRRTEELRRGGEEGLSVRTAQFIDDLIAERPIECDLWDGVAATLLTTLAIESAESGQPAAIEWQGRRPVLQRPPPMETGRLVEPGRPRPGCAEPAEGGWAPSAVVAGG